MKKCFLTLFTLMLLGQVSFGNIIIDLDVKSKPQVPMSNPFACGPNGCSFNWVNGSTVWMAIATAQGSYVPFSFVMTFDEGSKSYKAVLRESNSVAPIEGAGIAIPGYGCDFPSKTNQGYFQILNCSPQYEIARVYMIMAETVLTVSLSSANSGFTLFRIDPIIIYDLTSNNKSDISTSDALSADRTNPSAEPTAPTTIFPNPFSKSINIATTTTVLDQVRVQLLNANGQVLDAQTYPGGQSAYQFPTGEFPPGFYLLRVQAADRNEVFPVIKTQ